MKPTKQPGLWEFKRKFATLNLTPGKRFFENEDQVRIDNKQYRIIDPKHSKFAAAIIKGLQQTGLKPGNTVLYLGASHGYTPSFFSDIIGDQGMLFCLDVAPRVIRDLWFVCQTRKNMAPLFKDANHPETYKDLLPKEGVDLVFQDVAQRNQLDIFLKNCDMYLKQGGVGLLALKARSIDVTKHPKDIFKMIKIEFEKNPNYNVIDYRELYPFEKDHAFYAIKKK